MDTPTNTPIPVQSQGNIASMAQGVWSQALSQLYPQGSTVSSTPTNAFSYSPNGQPGDPRSNGAFFSIGVPQNLLAPSYTGGSNIIQQAAQTPFVWIALGAGVFIALIFIFKRA